ncbi:hypothetical protein PR048_016843 [Dryococelus australis]|uniref:Uncharacterized protein n=1 Tax=Dryococelus australis TaxID=614101 RepID=A0ABQ9H7U7_9NEOP|nr:hypothetical protein PR048_016843 [Dryococelus australis]
MWQYGSAFLSDCLTLSSCNFVYQQYRNSLVMPDEQLLSILLTLVILCFGLAVSTRYYLGYGLMALLVEMNSIFLHMRQLLLIQGVPKSRLFYRLNSLFCLGGYLLIVDMSLPATSGGRLVPGRQWCVCACIITHTGEVGYLIRLKRGRQCEKQIRREEGILKIKKYCFVKGEVKNLVIEAGGVGSGREGR